MKKIRLFLFFMVTCFVSHFSILAETTLLSKENIKNYKGKIERDIAFGKRMKYGMGGLIFLTASYMMYKWMGLDQKLPSGGLLSNQRLVDRLSKLETRFDETFDAEMFSPRWIKSTSKSILNNIIITSLGGFVVKATNKYYKYHGCFDSLESFVTIKLKKLRVLDEVVSNAQIFDFSVKEIDKNLERVKARFVVSFGNMISAIEYLIAFMQYRLDNILSYGFSLSKEELMLPEYLFNRTNTFCSNTKLLLTDMHGDHLSFLTVKFKEDLLGLLESFNGVENRFTWSS